MLRLACQPLAAVDRCSRLSRRRASWRLPPSRRAYDRPTPRGYAVCWCSSGLGMANSSAGTFSTVRHTVHLNRRRLGSRIGSRFHERRPHAHAGPLSRMTCSSRRRRGSRYIALTVVLWAYSWSFAAGFRLRVFASVFARAFALASRFALSRRPAKNSSRAASTFWRTASILGLMAISLIVPPASSGLDPGGLKGRIGGRPSWLPRPRGRRGAGGPGPTRPIRAGRGGPRFRGNVPVARGAARCGRGDRRAAPGRGASRLIRGAATARPARPAAPGGAAAPPRCRCSAGSTGSR